MTSAFAEDLAASAANRRKNGEELGNKITRLAGHMNAADHEFLKYIAEFDREKYWSGIGLRSCAHWLQWRCGHTLNAAREKLRVARCLEELPLIDAAFAAGKISFSMARALTPRSTSAPPGSRTGPARRDRGCPASA